MTCWSASVRFILNDAHIGTQSIVAANSLVPERKRFPPGVMLMGAPAKVVRELKDEERARVVGRPSITFRTRGGRPHSFDRRKTDSKKAR
jgi:carbonic anhydrase/acetyltransferase-like protein (isoleucine patch superfamily)